MSYLTPLNKWRIWVGPRARSWTKSDMGRQTRWLTLHVPFGPADAKDPRQSTIWQRAQRANWIRLPHTFEVMIWGTCCSAICGRLSARIQQAFSLGPPQSGSYWDLSSGASRGE